MAKVGPPVQVDSLTRWDQSNVKHLEPTPSAETEATEVSGVKLGSPFPFDGKLNKKLILWQGDICRLQIEAIVNTTNERLTDKSGVCGRIHEAAGPALAQQCRIAENCPTGDSIITGAGNLLAKHVIHTVGPRYSVKYQTAAENALHGCYRRSLEVLKDTDLSQIAFCVVNTDRKGYPRTQAAHIAFRTVRKFLMKYGGTIETIMFVVDNAGDMSLYSELLPLYFPRSAEEEAAALQKLPDDLGNELGEKVIEERQIRIGGVPDRRDSGGQFQAPPTPFNPAPFSEQKALRESVFTQMQDHPDDMREKRDEARPKEERERMEEQRRYNAYLRRAQEENLTDMQNLNFIYHSGNDASGRPIIVFVASHIPTSTVDMDRVLLYMLKVMDPLVESDFNVVYFHSLFSSSNKPPYSWLKELYSIFNRKYKKNMKRIFIVHPTFFTKMVMWFAKPFVSKKVWKKLFYIQRLAEIYEYVDPSALLVPPEIQAHDLEENGDFYAKQEGVLTDPNKDKNEGL